MSNQYRNALYYAAADLHTDLEKYGIEVNSDERVIIWRGTAAIMPPGSTKRECLRKLKSMIAAEKKLELQAQKENQVKLL
jgi:hypothetical protein